MSRFALSRQLTSPRLQQIAVRRCPRRPCLADPHRGGLSGTQLLHSPSVALFRQPPRSSEGRLQPPKGWLRSSSPIWKRTYAIQSGSVQPINSLQDVTSVLNKAQSTSKEARELQAVVSSSVATYNNAAVIIPKKAYENLQTLATEVVREARGGAKPDFATTTKNTVAAFKEALDTKGKWIDRLGKMQEPMTEYGSRLAALRQQLESAKRFLDGEKASHDRRRADAERQRNDAQRRLDETNNKIQELEQKLRDPFSDWKYKEAMKWAGIPPEMGRRFGGPAMAQALINSWAQEINANRALKSTLERERNSHQSRYGDANDRINDCNDLLRKVNNLSTSLSQEATMVNGASTSLQSTTRAMIGLKDSLSKMHLVLADMAAIAKENFRPSYRKQYARAILRILQMTPHVPAYNRWLEPIVRIMEDLPGEVLDRGKADPDDYGSPEPGLRPLLQEVIGLAKNRASREMKEYMSVVDL